MNWKESLKKDYAKNSGCKEVGMSLLRCATKEDAVELYCIHPDWCLERNFPTIDFIRQEFSGYEDNGLFVDRTLTGEKFSKQVGIFHHCTGKILVEMDYDNEVIPMLYFANGCNVTIECVQDNMFPIHVPIYIYGENTIVANNNTNVEFTHYHEALI